MKYPTPADLSVQPSDQERARSQTLDKIHSYLKTIDSSLDQAFRQCYRAVTHLYLDGIWLPHILEQELLDQLGGELAYGQCYEAAALAMLALRSNQSARLVYGTAIYSTKSGKRCDHAWVEFFVQGVPLVIDWAWFPGELCFPRVIYQYERQVQPIRVMPYAEFWSGQVARRLHAVMQDAGHSYVYPWLMSWRTLEGEYEPDLVGKFNALNLVRTKALRGQKHDYKYCFETMFELVNAPSTFKIPELALVL